MLKLRKIIPAVAMMAMPILTAVNVAQTFATVFPEVTGLSEDGTFEVFMAPPENMSERMALHEMIGEMTNWDYGITMGNEWHCNDDFTTCELAYHGEWTGEEYGITYRYSEEVDEAVDATMAGIEFSDEGYLVHDMEVVQYWAYGGETLPAFSSGVKSTLKNKNLDFVIDVRMGGGEPLLTHQGGEGKVFYDGTLYYVHSSPVLVYAPHIFYVEDDAKDVVKALEDRAAAIFGEGSRDSFAIELSDKKVSDLVEDWMDSYTYFEDYMDEKTYDFCISDGESMGTCEKIVILKDSSKLFTPVGVNSTDLMTNINITATAANLPADAATYAQEMGDDFEEIKEALGTDRYYTYELGLYSASLDAQISDNDGEKFTVSIPVPEKLEGVSLLSAYWVNFETGEPEEHYATVANGVATFDTTHFSTYTLAASSEDRPEESESDSGVPKAPDTGVVSEGFVVRLWNTVAL